MIQKKVSRYNGTGDDGGHTFETLNYHIGGTLTFLYFELSQEGVIVIYTI